MSPFEFLLNKNREGFVPDCKELFTSQDLKPTWPHAIEHCERYRRHLDALPIEKPLKVKSYLLKPEDIRALLQQGGGRDAIRIYIGHEHFPGAGHAVRLYMVACSANGSGGYDDWQIPERGATIVTDTLLGESRPCPDECSSGNSLNQP